LLGELAGEKPFGNIIKDDMVSILDSVKSTREKNGEPKYEP
jgi:hypothetical protein